jgi:ferric-dicitrate binding protein FerR (iron transport regulator)
MTTDSRPDLLRYIDGTMSPDEVHALEEKLRQDSGLRKELLIMAGFEADLPGALAAVAQEKRVTVRANTATFPSTPPAASRTARSETRRSAGTFHRVFWPVAAAAGLLLTAGIYLQAKKTFISRPQPSVAAGQPAKTTAPAPAPRAPAEGRLVAVSGEVRVARADGTGQPAAAAVGAEVFAGETILTATNASAQFAYADGSTLSIYRSSAVVLSRTAAGPVLDLRRGAVDADIRKQPDGRHLRILGELMHAEIVGTEFRLMVDSSSAWLGVREGKVEVTRVSDGQKILLGQANYAAVHPKWPYMKMDPLVCPVWKGVCQQAAGTPYP